MAGYVAGLTLCVACGMASALRQLLLVLVRRLDGPGAAVPFCAGGRLAALSLEWWDVGAHSHG